MNDLEISPPLATPRPAAGSRAPHVSNASLVPAATETRLVAPNAGGVTEDSAEKTEESRPGGSSSDQIGSLLAFLMQLLIPDFDPQLGHVPTARDIERDRKNGVDPGTTSRDAVAAAQNATGKVRAYLDAHKGASPVTHVNPVAGHSCVTCMCGHRTDPITGASNAGHDGVDIAPRPAGTNPAIGASAEGIVEYAGQMRGYGNIVILRHPDGTTTRYGHLDSISVKPGEELQQSQQLGVMGSTGRSTGVHLHFEQRDQSGHVINPVIEKHTLVAGENLMGHVGVVSSTPSTSKADSSPALVGLPDDPARQAASGAKGAGVIYQPSDDSVPRGAQDLAVAKPQRNIAVSHS